MEQQTVAPVVSPVVAPAAPCWSRRLCRRCRALLRGDDVRKDTLRTMLREYGRSIAGRSSMSLQASTWRCSRCRPRVQRAARLRIRYRREQRISRAGVRDSAGADGGSRAADTGGMAVLFGRAVRCRVRYAEAQGDGFECALAAERSDREDARACARCAAGGSACGAFVRAAGCRVSPTVDDARRMIWDIGLLRITRSRTAR